LRRTPREDWLCGRADVGFRGDEGRGGLRLSRRDGHVNVSKTAGARHGPRAGRVYALYARRK
jgi:hypothetical protein